MLPADRLRKLEDAYATLNERDQASLAYPLFQSTYISAKMTYRGLNTYLESKRLESTWSNISEVSPEYIIKELQSYAREQRKHAKLAEMGYLIDRPIKAMLDEAGLTTSYLVERIRDLYAHPPTQGQASFTIHGVIYTPSITNGTISGQLILSGNMKQEDQTFVFWQSGTARMLETRLPLTLQASLAGQPMRSVIDHPWLEGLTIRKAVSKGTLILHAVEPPIPAGAHDVVAI